MPEFRVTIDGKIPLEKERAIAAAIQQAVLPHVLDLGGDGEPVGVLIPHRDWWGFALRTLDAEVAEHAFGEQLHGGPATRS